MDKDGDTLLEVGTPGQKRNKNHSQQAKGNPDDCNLWLTHVGQKNGFEPGVQEGKAFPYIFYFSLYIFIIHLNYSLHIYVS